MPLKIFKGLWFLSVLALLMTLLYGYAGWQEQLVIREQGEIKLLMSREVVFYVFVGIFVLVNVLVYLIARLFTGEETFRAWFYGLIITINIFFIIAMNLIGLYNSYEKFDYGRIGFIIYGSVGLIILWAIAWPLYALFQKFFIKQSV